MNDDIKVVSFDNLKYTLKKTYVFKNQCLINFFIKEDDCPITDIIFDKSTKIDYSDYKEIKFNNNLSLYYSNNNKNGTLYFNNSNIVLNINMNSLLNNLFYTSFNFNDYNEKEISKEKKVIKVINYLKY